MFNSFVICAALIFTTSTVFAAPPEEEQKPILKQVRSYEALEIPLQKQLETLNDQIDIELSQYGYDFDKMPKDRLEVFIESQKEYVNMLQELTAALSSIYFSKTYTNNHPSVDDEVSSVTESVIKKCGLFKKVTNNCLDKKERLLFQAEYLNEKILDLEMQKSALLNGINFQLENETPVFNL